MTAFDLLFAIQSLHKTVFFSYHESVFLANGYVSADSSETARINSVMKCATV